MRASSLSRLVALLGAASTTLALGCSGTPAPTDAGSTGEDAREMRDAFRADDAAEPVDAALAPDASGPRCMGKGCEIVELALGFETTCARRGNGEVLCWGRGQAGELGDGSSRHLPGCIEAGESIRFDCSESAVAVALPAPALHVYSQGSFQFCAEVAGGEFYCWGSRGYRITGALEGDRLSPEITPTYRNAQSFADAFHHTCWLDAAGAPWCIGSNGFGQLAQGDFMLTTDPIRPTLDTGTEIVPVPNLVEIATATFFGAHVCGRTADQLYCWGINDSRQLGDATPHVTCVSGIDMFDCSPRALPITFAHTADIERLTLGADHTCALLTTGAAWCWGNNRTGQLGLGTAGAQDITLRAEPTEVAAVTDIAELALGARHSCARKNDGTVWCWGSNDLGQLGDGLEEHPEDQCRNGSMLIDCSSIPVQVAGIDDATSLVAGRQHTCVIRAGGTVWCWGNNDAYEVRPGTRLPVYTPTQVTSL